MSNFKRKFSNRLLAAILLLVMVLSMFPITGLTALVATAEHPDAVTITVTDDDGPVKGATVAYTINSVLNGEAYITDSKTTDDNGVVEVLPSSDFVADDLTIKATITAVGHEEGIIKDQLITAADQDISVTIVIKDVEISWSDNLEYNGKPQTLVSVRSNKGDISDIVKYKIDDESVETPEKTDAGTYTVEVTVTRDGKDPLTDSKDITIAKKALEIGFELKEGLTYNEKEQALVKVPTGIDIGDKVTWTVGEKDPIPYKDPISYTYTVNKTNIDHVPVGRKAGEYEIGLKVERNDNYTVFEKKLTAKISPATINDLDAQLATDLVYNGKDQELVKKDDKSGKYISGLEDGDIVYFIVTNASEVADSNAWVEWTETSLPVGTNAGDYTVRIKVVRANYKDIEVKLDPTTVTIAKASQSLKFIGEAPAEVIIDKDNTDNNVYDFTVSGENLSGSGENLSGNDIVYSLENASNSDVASIEAKAGIVTVKKAGVVTIKASRSGNSNYEDGVIYRTLTVSEVRDLINFTNSTVTYTLDEDGIASEQKVNVTHADEHADEHADNGAITYSIDKTDIGLSIDAFTGIVTITCWKELFIEMKKNRGSASVVVRVEKTAGTVSAKEWSEAKGEFIKAEKEIYKEAKTSYTLSINYEKAPAFDTVCNITEPSATGWYNFSNPAVIEPIDSTAYSVALDVMDREAFGSSITVTDQGTDTHYIFLENLETKKISAGIPINIKVDTVLPSNLNISFSELTLIQKLGQSLGFYNPTVTITFTAEDVTSGIDHFDWTYTPTPESGTPPVTKEIAVKVSENKATAELTLPADQAEQLHGKISFTATDQAGNKNSKADDDHVFIVDTIAPKLSIKYQSKTPYLAQEAIYNGAHFFNSDVAVELTITETNFYAEDVVVEVSKNGAAPTEVTPSWNNKVGTFTLDGDGDYVVYVTYTDKANNKMTEYASETITVDKTAPVVRIDYVHNGDVQKTTFTVTEHNFRASDVVITGTMKDITGADIAYTAEQLTAMLQNAQWTPTGDTSGDTYTYEFDQYNDGIYNLKMDYKDISGWDATQFVSDEFIIDHSASSEPTVEYVTTPWDTILNVNTFGYYNPSVTVRFTSYDTSSGVESFTWGYTKETGASTINHPESLADATISAVQDQADKSKFTAEITLTAEQAAQYRGYLSVLATDTFQNKSVKKVDNGNIIVVDTIVPTLDIEYTPADHKVGEADYFYNNNVEVKLTVIEANFNIGDVVVTVTKNGEAFNYGTIAWGNRNAEDKTIGTFTLPAPADHSGDGHYVITVEYTDRSNNEMVKYVSDTHTIDTTLPVINVEYQNKTVANKLDDRDGNEREYFADAQTAVITINEHNFTSDEVEFEIIAKDVTGAELDAAALSSKTAWSVDSTGDIHTITITYLGDANYTFDVAYTDKATNAAEDYAMDYFTVDKTAPTNLTVSYNTSVLDTVLESVTFGFYNAKMTVTLTAEDPTTEVSSFLYSYLNAAGVSNVNAEVINETIRAADIKYSSDSKTATATFEIPKMVLENDNQFNGIVEFTATDRAGNETDVHKETKRIIVDNIAPTAQVSYNEATNVVGDTSYYNGNINATVTIDEANFYANDVQVMVSKDGGAATAVTPTWTDNSADVHVGTFTLTEDGDYTVTINYKDKSSNTMATYTSKQMTIDTKIVAPTYTINGTAKTEIGGAYKGEATIGFNFVDQNFDTETINLTRTRFNKVEDVTDTFVRVTDNYKGGSGNFTIPSEVGNDGIYVLKIGTTDKAKHTIESEIKFTINRFGSIYEYGDELVNLIKDGGQYVRAVDKDLVVTEYNANRLLEGSLKILITRDGETVDVGYKSNSDINAQAGIGENGWYQYVYTIKAFNFDKDGVYKISLTSVYDADDKKGNESTSVPENSFAEDGQEILDTMRFTVDSVAPEIRNIVNLDKAIADLDKIIDGKLNVKYTIVDVGGLKTMEIIVNGETIQTLTEEDIAENAYNFTGSFDLEEQAGTTSHKVQLRVTDLAGNVTDTNSDEFLKAHSADNENSTYVFFNEVTVSRNFFVRWYANTGLFWGSIAGVIVLAAGIWFLIAFKRKKKEEASK